MKIKYEWVINVEEIKLMKYSEKFKYSLTIECIDDADRKFGSDIEPIEIGSVELKDIPDLSKIGVGDCSPYNMKFYLISQNNKGIVIIKKECKHLGGNWEDCLSAFTLF
jgi:hypothetical protein